MQKKMNNTTNMTPGFLVPDRHRVRRSSSKDVEEAMAGGLGKVGKIYFIEILIFFYFRQTCIYHPCRIELLPAITSYTPCLPYFILIIIIIV